MDIKIFIRMNGSESMKLVILAGGYGSRLGNLTNSIPKQIYFMRNVCHTITYNYRISVLVPLFNKKNKKSTIELTFFLYLYFIQA